MAADSQWKPAYDVTITVNGADMPATTGSFAESVGDFDTTNTTSQGDDEFGVDVTRRELQFTLPVDEDNVVMPAIKDLVPASFSDGIETHTGSFRVLSRTKKGGGKGGYMLDYSGRFTGAVVKS